MRSCKWPRARNWPAASGCCTSCTSMGKQSLRGRMQRGLYPLLWGAVVRSRRSLPSAYPKRNRELAAAAGDERTPSRQRRRGNRAAVRLPFAKLGPFDAQLEQELFDHIGEKHVLVEDFQLADCLNTPSAVGQHIDGRHLERVDNAAQRLNRCFAVELHVELGHLHVKTVMGAFIDADKAQQL